MQESPAFPQWIQTAFGWLASGVAGGLIVRLYTTWLYRKKPAAEIHLTQATATEVTVRASSSASDAVMRMMDHLGQAQLTIDRLRQERDAWQDEYDKAFTEKDEVVRQNLLLQGDVTRLEAEIEHYENQLTTMRITLGQQGKNYDNTQGAKPGQYVMPSKDRLD
jgi:flagellar biosynthesis chaperone FliJ